MARDLTIRLGSSCIRVGRRSAWRWSRSADSTSSCWRAPRKTAGAHEAITQMIMEVANSRSDGQRPSMGQDIRKGRRTETDDINGLVARRGDEVGVDVRFHRRVNDIIKRIEKGELAPVRRCCRTSWTRSSHGPAAGSVGFLRRRSPRRLFQLDLGLLDDAVPAGFFRCNVRGHLGRRGGARHLDAADRLHLVVERYAINKPRP